MISKDPSDAIQASLRRIHPDLIDQSSHPQNKCSLGWSTLKSAPEEWVPTLVLASPDHSGGCLYLIEEKVCPALVIGPRLSKEVLQQLLDQMTHDFNGKVMTINLILTEWDHLVSNDVESHDQRDSMLNNLNTLRSDFQPLTWFTQGSPKDVIPIELGDFLKKISRPFKANFSQPDFVNLWTSGEPSILSTPAALVRWNLAVAAFLSNHTHKGEPIDITISSSVDHDVDLLHIRATSKWFELDFLNPESHDVSVTKERDITLLSACAGYRANLSIVPAGDGKQTVNFTVPVHMDVEPPSTVFFSDDTSGNTSSTADKTVFSSDTLEVLDQLSEVAPLAQQIESSFKTEDSPISRGFQAAWNSLHPWSGKV